jgi:hypothetical protein
MDESHALARKLEKKEQWVRSSGMQIAPHALYDEAATAHQDAYFIWDEVDIPLPFVKRHIVVCLMCMFNGNATLLWVRTRNCNPGERGIKLSNLLLANGLRGKVI